VQPADEALHGARGTYRVFDRVGGGGFGTVFFGRDLGNNQPVALKRLHPHFVHDPRVVARFEREADLVLVRGLQHPNLVRILDRGRDAQGVPFLAMEWIDGRTISDLLSEHGNRFPIADAAAIGCQVLEGLEAAHALLIVHRDIKPSNLMVTATGHVKVMDLGIARETGPGSTSVTGVYSAVPATLEYAAPEQLAGDRPVDGRADLYALGATLYLVLTGRAPFSGPARPDPTPMEQLRPETSGELAAIVKRALALEPTDRFASASTMLGALRPFAPADLRVALPIASRPTSSHTVDTGSRPGVGRPPAAPVGPSRKFPLLPVGTGLLIALIALVTVAIGLSQSSTPNPSNPTPSVLSTAAGTSSEPGLIANLPAPATWAVLKNDLADMTYTGDDVFATWMSTFDGGVLKYQLAAKSDVAYPVPVAGRDVGPQFHYAVSARQLSGPPSASYGLLVGYPSGARAADVATAYYEFVIDNKSEARFALRKDGVWKTLWQGDAVRAVKPGDTNTFVVHAESAAASGGTHFTVFLNGQYVTDLVDAQLAQPGAVGVLMVLEGAGDAATWEFSNLELRAPRTSP
jgi:serine/threonine protein kinase